MSQVFFQAPGIFPRWKKRKSVIKSLYGWHEDLAGMANEIEQYNDFYNRDDEVFVCIPETPYKRYGLDLFRKTIGRALDGKPWETAFSQAIAYQIFGQKLDFYSHYRIRLRAPNHPQKLRMMSIPRLTDTMAGAFLIGWREDATYLGYLAHAALRRAYNLQLEYQEEHRRGTAFMLRLFADWRGDVSHDWPPYGYDEPIYEAILAEWRHPDPDALVPALLAACDRHTHETLMDSSKKFYDFSENEVIRTPFEILMVFRLRQFEGLENPILDHPLMERPFHTLPEPQPPYGLDDRMQGTLARMRQEWPDFEAAVSLTALKG